MGPNKSSYHVEVRQAFPSRARIRALASGSQAMQGWRSRETYVSRQAHDGKPGVVVLVNGNTGYIVAKRMVPQPI